MNKFFTILCLSSLLLVSCSPKPPHQAKLLAHRGFWSTAGEVTTDENTIDALIRAHHNLQHVLDGLSINLSGDLLSEDLRLVLADLAEITGEGQITPQETLNNIFSHFCVGK